MIEPPIYMGNYKYEVFVRYHYRIIKNNVKDFII